MTLESVIARLLGVGTAIACVLMAIGMVASDQRIVVAGIACLVALPILRVAVMVIAFAKQRDARFAAAGVLVLAIIGLGVGLFGF